VVRTVKAVDVVVMDTTRIGFGLYVVTSRNRNTPLLPFDPTTKFGRVMPADDGEKHTGSPVRL
jgi:hypothetical protein